MGEDSTRTRLHASQQCEHVPIIVAAHSEPQGRWTGTGQCAYRHDLERSYTIDEAKMGLW